MLLPCSRIVFLMAVVSFVATSAQGVGQEAQTALNASLKGLTSVSVYIDPIDADAERDGLSKTQVQTLVELRLRQSGINVLPMIRLSPPEGPHGVLWVTVTTAKLSDVANYILNIRASLLRSVAIVGGNLTTSAATWWTPDALAIAPTRELGKHMREVVSDQVDTFANAYLSVNPKK